MTMACCLLSVANAVLVMIWLVSLVLGTLISTSHLSSYFTDLLFSIFHSQFDSVEVLLLIFLANIS
jgi:hypothetical protein